MLPFLYDIININTFIVVKYVDTKVVFREIPDEITLAINISNCPCGCDGCHSSYLAKDIGNILNKDALENLISSNPGITCVAFMGGDADPKYINNLALLVNNNKDIKVAWYSGRDYISPNIDVRNFDYIKVGPYKKECGPLDNPNTNQRLYKINKVTEEDGQDNVILEDITSKFWKNGTR